MHLHNRLHNTLKGTRSISDFVQDIQRICEELAAAGHPVQETVAIYAILRGLGSSYSAFCAGISANLTNLCLDDVIAQIHSYDELTKFSNPTKDTLTMDFSPAANQTQVNSSDRGRGRNNGRNNRGRGRNGGRYTPRCQLCGQYGHRVLECRERFNRTFHGHQHAPAGQNPQTPPPQAYNLNLGSSPATQNHIWYPDSGATHHVTNDGQNLTDPSLYQGPDQLQIANGSGLTIYSIGSSSLISRSYPLKLSNILHVPEIRKKLLSVYRLTNDNAVYVEFHATYCVVKDEATGKPLLQETVRDGLYLLEQAHQPQVNIGERTSLNQWHHRLGHPNLRVLQNVISLYGLPTLSSNKNLVCDACLSSKSHRLPYSYSQHQTTKPLEIIHSDLWGPSPVTSRTGNRYYVIFIDDFTRYTWLYPLKLKSDVMQSFLDFQHRVERQFNLKIINLQSDWGGEFQALTKHLRDQGINHRISCPHTPAQNGTAERKHRHIIETALSLMHHASLPHQFWDEAVCASVYLINRLPTPNLDNKSPFYRVYHQEPDYTLLKSFGCACYPCLRAYSSSKFDSRSERCIFLGYSAFHHGYRCMSLTSGRLYISRDVIFQEHIFPFQEQPEIINTEPGSSPSILGTSPLLTKPNSEASSPHQHSSTATPTASERSEEHHLSPAELEVHTPSTAESEDHDPPTHLQVRDDSTSDFSHKGHTPSADPLSPSNLDCHNSNPNIKTRRLSDIIQTIDSVNNTHPPKFPLPTCLHISSSIPTEPINFSSAIKQPKWLEAMKEEFNALTHNKTWTLVPRPPNRPVIGCKWIYKIKPSTDGSSHKHKARLVAKGYLQEGGIDYHETFSPVIKVTTIRLLLSLAISQGWHIRQLDISNAFLHGDLHEIIYMDQPPGFHSTQFPHYVCQLQKSLYGLKQAPREWFHKLTGQLLNMGFHDSKTDTSLFYTLTGPIYILIYVDDILILGPSLTKIQSLISSLSTHFKLKDLGPASRFLGVEFQAHQDGFLLTQTQYTISILQKMKMENCKPLPTPCPITCSETLSKVVDNPHLYRQAVGALQYLNFTRPDISYAVNLACRSMHSP